MTLSPVLVATLGLGPGISPAQVAALGLLPFVDVEPPPPPPPTPPPPITPTITPNGGMMWPGFRIVRSLGDGGREPADALGFARAVAIVAGWVDAEDADALGVVVAEALASGAGDAATAARIGAIARLAVAGWGKTRDVFAGSVLGSSTARGAGPRRPELPQLRAQAIATTAALEAFRRVLATSSSSGVGLALGASGSRRQAAGIALRYPWAPPSRENDDEAAVWLELPVSVAIQIPPVQMVSIPLPMPYSAQVELGHGLVAEVQLYPPAAAVVHLRPAQPVSLLLPNPKRS